MKFKLTKIAGDASFRQFYRLFKGAKTSIIVESKREKFKTNEKLQRIGIRIARELP